MDARICSACTAGPCVGYEGETCQLVETIRSKFREAVNAAASQEQ